MESDMKTFFKWFPPVLVACIAPAAALAVDAEASKALIEQNNCLQCHGVRQDKDGPSFAKSAEKFRAKANGEEEIIKHITSGRQVKLADGSTENHKVVKTIPPNDMAQMKNLAGFILSIQQR
jgi:cytochrome c